MFKVHNAAKNIPFRLLFHGGMVILSKETLTFCPPKPK